LAPRGGQLLSSQVGADRGGIPHRACALCERFRDTDEHVRSASLVRGYGLNGRDDGWDAWHERLTQPSLGLTCQTPSPLLLLRSFLSLSVLPMFSCRGDSWARNFAPGKTTPSTSSHASSAKMHASCDGRQAAAMTAHPYVSPGGSFASQTQVEMDKQAMVTRLSLGPEANHKPRTSPP
jgi:hypothetical protein